jgi:hypothetical protein
VALVLLGNEGTTDPQHPCETVNEFKEGMKKIILKTGKRLLEKRKFILAMKRTELVAAQEIIVGRMWRRWSN